MKKAIVLLFTMILLIALTACGNSTENKKQVSLPSTGNSAENKKHVSLSLTLSNASTSADLDSAAKKAVKDNVQTAYVKDHVAVIEFKNEVEWDEITLIQNFDIQSTDILQKERKNPNFQAFAFIRRTNFTNVKGKERNGTAVIAYFTKKNAKSITYNNFIPDVDLSPYKFYKVSDGYYINPGIYLKVKKSMNGLTAYKDSHDSKLSDDFPKELTN